MMPATTLAGHKTLDFPRFPGQGSSTQLDQLLEQPARDT